MTVKDELQTQSHVKKDTVLGKTYLEVNFKTQLQC